MYICKINVLFIVLEVMGNDIKSILEYMLINKGDSLDHITWYILILVMIANIVAMY